MEIKYLLAAFIALIIGVVLIGTIATEQANYSQLSKTKNESITVVKYNGVDVNTTWVYTVSNAPAFADDSENGCNISSLVLSNTTDGTAWTITTDYSVNSSTGTISLVNTSNTVRTANNLSYVNYYYCDDGYLRASWGRVMLNLVPGFMAIAILLVSVGVFYKIGRDTGII